MNSLKWVWCLNHFFINKVHFQTLLEPFFRLISHLFVLRLEINFWALAFPTVNGYLKYLCDCYFFGKLFFFTLTFACESIMLRKKTFKTLYKKKEYSQKKNLTLVFFFGVTNISKPGSIFLCLILLFLLFGHGLSYSSHSWGFFFVKNIFFIFLSLWWKMFFFHPLILIQRFVFRERIILFFIWLEGENLDHTYSELIFWKLFSIS